MLPRHVPSIEGVETAALYLPSLHVGGSLYDVFQIAEDLYAFALFETIGSGVEAALKAAAAKVSFVSNIRSGVSPRAVMNRVCADLAEYIGGDPLAAAFVGYLDLHSNRLTYSHHGLPCAAVYRARERNAYGLRTSTVPRRTHDEKSIVLNPGDWFTLFTVGFAAALCGNPEPAEIATEQAIAALIGDRGPQEVLAGERKRWAGHELSGDLAAVAVQMLTQSRRNLLKTELGFEPTDPVYLQYLSYFEEMDKVIGVILKSMDNHGYADDTIRKMKITLTELLVNGVHHGNDKDPSKKVTVGHMIDKHRTIISILDEGIGFDPEKVPDPTLPENLIKDSGRGLYIVRCYVDELRFNTMGNRVTIVKNGYARQ